MSTVSIQVTSVVPVPGVWGNFDVTFSLSWEITAANEVVQLLEQGRNGKLLVVPTPWSPTGSDVVGQHDPQQFLPQTGSATRIKRYVYGGSPASSDYKHFSAAGSIVVFGVGEVTRVYVAGVLGGDTPACPPDQVWNPETEQCELPPEPPPPPPPTCPYPTVWNPATQACEMPPDSPPVCPLGSTWNPDTLQCEPPPPEPPVCPPGTEYDVVTGTCSIIIPPPPDPRCLYLLDPPVGNTLPKEGGRVRFTVVTGCANCAWIASALNSFGTIVEGSSGIGDGVVVVDINPGTGLSGDRVFGVAVTGTDGYSVRQRWEPPPPPPPVPEPPPEEPEEPEPLSGPWERDCVGGDEFIGACALPGVWGQNNVR